MNLPTITIILLTYRRTDYALRTIAAARQHLRYAGELRWYVADDGSEPAHVDTVMAAAAPLYGWHTVRRGYGGNANAAWREADGLGPLSLWLEDDWVLRAPLDLTPYARLLLERDEVGLVRLGILNLDVRGRTWGHDGRLYWTLDHTPHHDGTPVFTGHPSLRHTRYRDVYGWYPEGLTPGDTELSYAYQYRIGPPSGPAIVWPASYPEWGLFDHIGEIKTETLL